MPKPVVALLAVPVLAWVVAVGALRRFSFVRSGLAVAIGVGIAVTAIGLARPEPIAATLPTVIVPVPQAEFRAVIATDMEVDGAATIAFSTPMDPASVEAAVVVTPATPVAFTWNATTTELIIRPDTRWAAATYHTVTVEPGALAASGRPMTKPARTAFVTRAPASARLAATAAVDERVATDTAFIIRFDRSVDAATVADAITFEPAVQGSVVAGTDADGNPEFTFTPATPLKAATWYRLTVTGVRDGQGVAVDLATRAFRTFEAPGVVRFRPRAFDQDIDRGASISVRFTTAMGRAATKAAFRVEIDGKPIKGTISFAEGDTVLVFDPALALPWDTRVDVTVSAKARSVDGTPLARAVDGAFRTAPKPVPPAPPTTTPTKPPAPSGGSSGGSVGSGSWGAVEGFYLDIMNCTRTGGWVTSSGGCSSPGGRSVAALKLDSGISSKVSRPYAKVLATKGACDHFIGGNPGDRLRRAGYTNYVWAENLGCRSGDPKSAVLGSHLFFQSERSWSPLGGHYVNLMNAKYDRAGIGVWVSGGRVRLVVDFYHP